MMIAHLKLPKIPKIPKLTKLTKFLKLLNLTKLLFWTALPPVMLSETK